MYQWLLILIVLLFFIYNFTNVNKECFSIGGNDIQISSQLFLTDGCKKDPCDGVICIRGSCKNGSCVCSDNFAGNKCDKQCFTKNRCIVNASCENKSCFYNPDNIELVDNVFVKNCSANCKNGSQVKGKLCISNTKKAIDAFLDKGSVLSRSEFLKIIKEIFNKDKMNEILCKSGTKCGNKVNDVGVDKWQEIYNNVSGSETVKKICNEYMGLKGGIRLEDCTELLIGTCI